VISVGFNIDEILKNPANPDWAKTSIEFCGGTHVSQTGDIKRFVILEESSISKGIRRIIGVTGEEAFKYNRLAEDYEKRIHQLEKFTFVELEPAIKSMQRELEEAVLPLIQKHELKEKFNSIKKKFLEEDKLKKARESKEAVEWVKTYFDENPDSLFVVRNIPVGSNTKALNAALQHVKTLKDKAAMFATVDAETQKVHHMCVVSNVRYFLYSFY
jgi:alanyl-tRNA synthetase